MRNAAIFFFLAAASTGLFGFLIATHWIETRAAERRVRDRLALLKKIADQPAESGRLVIDLLREEDAREEQRARLKRQKAIRDDLQGGALIVAAGVGVSIMLAAIAPPGIWTVGLVPALVGVVIFTFAYFSKSLDDAAADGEADG